MAPASKQDVQSIINVLQNRVLERTALRQDVQALTEVVKNLLTICQQNQQLLRQSQYQRLQLVRRAVAIEARMAQLEAEARSMRAVVSRLSEQQTLPQRFDVPTPESQTTPTQYQYRPAQ